MSEFNNVMPWGGMKRCILNPDGTNAGYLDSNNSNNWETGGVVDWRTVESSGQNCMVEIPKFYYSKQAVGDERIFGVADAPTETSKVGISDWKIHPAFYRERNKLCDDQTGIATEVDFRYFSAFDGWFDAQGKMRSLPNKMPTASKNYSQFRNSAKLNGNGWGMIDYNLIYAVQMLYITEFGHGNSQTEIGRGYVDGNAGYINTGGTLQHGNNTFGETTGKIQMSYRGIEDLWGNFYTFVDGLVTNGSWNILIGNKGFNDTGVGYKNVGKGATSNFGGNIRDIQENEDAGFIIKTSGGAHDTDGLYDYGYLFSARLPSFGGYRSLGSAAGVFQLPLDRSASRSYASCGSRLCL